MADKNENHIIQAIDLEHKYLPDDEIKEYVYAGLSHTKIASIALDAAVGKFPEELNTCNQNGETPLSVSIKMRKEAVVECLINAGVEINTPINIYNEGEYTPLAYAIRYARDTTIPSIILKKGGKFDVKNIKDEHWSIFLTSFTLFPEPIEKEIVKCNLTPNVLNDDDNIPLFLAVIAGYHDIVFSLLEHGANPNIQDINGNSLLYLTIKAGYYHIASLLLKYGAIQNKDEESPLLFAVKEGKLSMVSNILMHGIDLNIQDKEGNSPLLLAAKAGYYHIASILLEHGANPNIQDKDKNSPLLLAVKDGQHDMVSRLLEHGTEHNIQDKDGNSPLFLAVKDGNQDIVSVLLQHGADPNIQDKDKNSPLFLAAKTGCYHIASILLEHGANPNIQDINGNSLLHLTIKARYYHIASLLLKYGAIQNKDEESPLLFAVKEGKLSMVSDILTHGIDLNIQDKEGNSPLLLAVKDGNQDIVSVLLQHGVNSNMQDNKNKSALDITRDKILVAEAFLKELEKSKQKIKITDSKAFKKISMNIEQKQKLISAYKIIESLLLKFKT